MGRTLSSANRSKTPSSQVQSQRLALGLDAVPGHTPAHELGARIRRKAQVGVPAGVVLGERVLVDGPLARPLLRHEGVLDADTEVQGTVAEPGGQVGAAHLSPVVAMLSMKRRCTNRNPITSGTIASNEPAIMTP